MVPRAPNPSQNLECFPHGLYITVGQCQRALVRAAEREPCIGGRAPIANDLQAVWLCDVFRNAIQATGAPQPERERAPVPVVCSRFGNFIPSGGNRAR